MRRLVSILLLPLILLAGQGRAHDVDEVAHAFAYEYEEIGLFDSLPGETKNDFMVRVGEGLLEFTQRRGFEGCGMVQNRDGGGWRVRLTTTRSQVACARISFHEVGFTGTTEFIHSHPPITKIVLNRVDAMLLRRMEGDTISVYPPEYSERDLDNGGGWLVVPKFRWEKPRLLFSREGRMKVVEKRLAAVAMAVPAEPGKDAHVIS